MTAARVCIARRCPALRLFPAFLSVPRAASFLAGLSGFCRADDAPSSARLERLPPAPVAGSLDFRRLFFGLLAAGLALERFGPCRALFAFDALGHVQSL